jgi:tetratricopeptide (TPR) repeat protein
MTKGVFVVVKQLLMASAFTLVSASTGFSFPAGGGDDMTKTKPKVTSPKTLKCKRNETARRVKRNGRYRIACVKLKADVLPDSELYLQARQLADQGEYEWALDHLRLARKQDKEVLTYTGYANRKAGRVETGIAFYQQALAIDPDYVEAREYLGEAYALAGFTSKAQEQLAEIAKRCPANCEAFETLQGFIQQHSN